jgi:RNA polymerase primary sigma factor
MSKSKVRKAGAEFFPEKGSAQCRNFMPSRHGIRGQREKSGAGFAKWYRPELSEKIKELVRLAQEQGHLTYNDINDCPAGKCRDPENWTRFFPSLRALEIEIVDQAEVDNVKTPMPRRKTRARLDILDDPVRMYLKQMGLVALLTREQEVEISKRIEAAETEVTKIIYSLGFAGKEHIALAEKLLADPPRERFDRVVLEKKVDSRDAHLRALRRLIARVRQMDQDVDRQFHRVAQRPRQSQAPPRASRRSSSADQKLQARSRNFASSTRSSRK